MVLIGTHWIRGRVLTPDGTGIDGVQVRLVNYDELLQTDAYETIGGGYFQLNAQDVANNGDTIVVHGTLAGETAAEIITEFITIDITELHQEVNLQFSEPAGDQYALGYYLEGLTLWISKSLPRPYWAGADNNIQFKGRLFNLWDGTIEQVIYGLGSDEVIIEGYDFVEYASAWAHTMNEVINGGRVITVRYLGDKLSGDYVVKKFSLRTKKETTSIFDYTLVLEPVEDR
ncbi:MAG: hypothetical protein R6U65_10615 [Perlabentimonas sp.]